MSVEIKIPVTGATLNTKKKYVEEDITVTPIVIKYNGEASVDVTPDEDAILERTIVTYRNDRITKLGPAAFFHCKNLKELYLPNVVTMDGSCFAGGMKMEKLEMPKLETIGTKGFDYISFPELKAPLKKMSNYALMGNSILERLIITQDEVVCTLGGANVFQATTIATNTEKGFVYVPDTLVDSYKTATNWSAVAHKIKPLSELEEE